MNPASAPTAATSALAPWQLDMYVGAEADGDATPEQLAVLEADKLAWRSALSRLLRDAEEHLASARTLQGEDAALGKDLLPNLGDQGLNLGEVSGG